MKKTAFLFFFALTAFQSFSQVPDLLKGVWKNSSRYIEFDSGIEREGKAVPRIVLRTFYRWYDDRAAEPREISERTPRDQNDTTQKSPAEELLLNFIPLVPEQENSTDSGDEIPSGAWIMEVIYPGRKEVWQVPVAVIGKNLYLDFLIKENAGESVPFSPLLDGTVLQDEKSMNGFWRDTGKSSGILVSPPVSAKELLCWYFSDGSVYHIRYWRTDMDYDAEKRAVFSDGETMFQVPKHLRYAGNTFTCVNGRRSTIRNIEKVHEISGEYEINSVLLTKRRVTDDGQNVEYKIRTSTICCLGKPWMTLVSGKTVEDIIAEDSKLHPPAPSPLFPPHGALDFDFGIVEDPPKDYNRRMLDLGK